MLGLLRCWFGWPGNRGELRAAARSPGAASKPRNAEVTRAIRPGRAGGNKHVHRTGQPGNSHLFSAASWAAWPLRSKVLASSANKNSVGKSVCRSLEPSSKGGLTRSLLVPADARACAQAELHIRRCCGRAKDAASNTQVGFCAEVGDHPGGAPAMRAHRALLSEGGRPVMRSFAAASAAAAAVSSCVQFDPAQRGERRLAQHLGERCASAEG